jgi:non-ribosomal peptide synthetase component F
MSEFLQECITIETTIASNLISEFQPKFESQVTDESIVDLEKLERVFPCTAAQEGMLSQFIRSEGKLYFNHVLLKILINIDEGKLKSAWDSYFSATDILRSGFVEFDDGISSFATITYKKEHIELPWSTKTVIGASKFEETVKKQKSIAAAAALENLQLPPWRIVFFVSANDEKHLLFSGHHALYDATCLQIIFRDVAALYLDDRSRIFGRSQFGSILEEIIQHTLDQPIIDQDRKFWLKQLQGSSICRFPNLCPLRVTSTNYNTNELTATWSLSEIESVCKICGFSLHAAGQAAWARVLSAYTGDTTLTMGVVLSGRLGLKDASEVVFPCLVTLPSVCVLENSNQQLVLDIQSSNTRTLKHQHTPLRSIQKWFEHPEESFFDTLFVYQKTGGHKGSKLFWEVVEEDASTDYVLSLEIEPTAYDSLLIRAVAKDSHIPVEQTKLIVRQFEAALIDILENPKSRSTDLSAIPKDLLSISPAVVNEIPTDIELLHEFVERRRDISPDKVAFEFITAIVGDEITKKTWTYSQLDEEGNTVANFLLEQGVGIGSIIGISFEKCPEASFAMLGILKAGCAYVAVDYSAPIDRKAFIIRDSQAVLVLTMDKYVSELQNVVDVKVFSAESHTAIKMAPSHKPQVDGVKRNNLCYCLYTSGTTGAPKGCELTHENAVQAMLAFQRLFAPHWDSESRFLQFASFHFDVSVLEQYWSWSVGVCVTSAPRDLIFEDLSRTISKLRITHLDLTPSLAALLRPDDVPHLRKGVFITGGETLKQEILDLWGEVGVIYNGYRYVFEL